MISQATLELSLWVVCRQLQRGFIVEEILQKVALGDLHTPSMRKVHVVFFFPVCWTVMVVAISY